MKKLLKWGLLMMAAVVLVLAVIDLWVSTTTNGRVYTETSEVPARDVALVLGTSRRVANGNRNLFFDYRMQAAAELYLSGKVRKILVSGDNSIVYYDEPTDMKKALIKLGVPEKDIVLDYAGFRTFDSVVRAKEIFGTSDPIIISQPFHVQRALFIADKKGLSAIGYEAKDPPHNKSFAKVRVRETFARLKAVLDIYLLPTEPKFLGKKEPIIVKR